LIDWQIAVTESDEWLDRQVGYRYRFADLAQDWARVAKIGEELGEAIDALIGYTGQNPRKGEYGSVDDLLNELADVAFTGILAIQHFTKSYSHTAEILNARIERIHSRVTNA
jgi:NTP pyrophosphatase (non-canonical NTP hydrolase)